VSRPLETTARPPKWRRILVALLVVIGCILAPLAMLGIWLRAEILDTGRYVSTMTPLADHPDIQIALADRITEALLVDSSLEDEVESQLPERAQFLSPKLSDAFSSIVHDAALNVVQSDQFGALWREANRRAHSSVVALLEGDKSGRLGVENGEITLDLGPIAEKVDAALEEQGIDAFANSSRVQDNQIVLVDSIWLERVQTWTDLLQRIVYTLPILMFLCFGIAIWLSPNRRRTILRSALGVALALAIVTVGINSGRHFYLSALPDSVNQNAAGAVYDQLMSDLRLALRTGFVLGLVIGLGAWLSGPARPATRIRDSLLGLARRPSGDGTAVSPVASFVGRHRKGLRGLAVGVGLAILVGLSSPSPTAVLVIAALVLLGILLIEFLGRNARPSEPGPPESDRTPDEPPAVERAAEQPTADDPPVKEPAHG
jgi:hypothetical protein